MNMTFQQKWSATKWLLSDLISVAAYFVLLIGSAMLMFGDRSAAIAAGIGDFVTLLALAYRFRQHWLRLS